MRLPGCPASCRRGGCRPGLGASGVAGGRGQVPAPTGVRAFLLEAAESAGLPRCRLAHSAVVDAPHAPRAGEREITPDLRRDGGGAEWGAGGTGQKRPSHRSVLCPPKSLRRAAEASAGSRRGEEASGAAAAGAVAGLRAPARFCNDARAGRPPQLRLSCYHMTDARGLGAPWKRGEKRLPGSPLVHTSSAGRGGAGDGGGGGEDAEETPCESEIRFQNRGQGRAARAGKLPPPPSPFAAPVPAFLPLGPSLPHSPAPSAKHEGHPRATAPPGGGTGARSFLVPRASRAKRPRGNGRQASPGNQRAGNAGPLE